MKNKRNRLQLIADLLRSKVIGSQEELLQHLYSQNCEITQATLSRDLKQLKVAKTPLSNGLYKYILPVYNKPTAQQPIANSTISYGAVLSVEFSGNLAVVKTKPGYASAIAWDIDNNATNEVLGTVAGDDTIIVVPREGITRKDIFDMMKNTFADK